MKDREELNELLKFDIDRLIEYSYHKSLLKKSSFLDFYKSSIIQPWLNAVEEGRYKIWLGAEGKQEVVLLYEYLAWDTSYFDIPSYKIIAILFKTKNERVINENLNNFLKFLGGNVHIDMEVPSLGCAYRFNWKHISTVQIKNSPFVLFDFNCFYT